MSVPPNKPIDQRTIDVPQGVIGFSREQAARYIGVSSSLFDKMVKDGRMPKPIRICKDCLGSQKT